MLAIYLLVIAAVVGVIASRGNPRLAMLYLPVALVGALFGAFVAFGDAPFLLRYSIFSPFALALACSVIAVSGVWIWQRRKTTDR